MVGYLFQENVSDELESAGEGDVGRRTWDRVTIERLHFVFGSGDANEKFAHAVGAFERLPVPCQGGIGSVEVGDVVKARGGVVCGVVEPRKVFRRSSGNLNAAMDSQ